MEDGDPQGGERITYLVIASDVPFPEERLSIDRPVARRWVAAADRRAPNSRRCVLTDDHAPVDRLMSHILFDPDLAER